MLNALHQRSSGGRRDAHALLAELRSADHERSRRNEQTLAQHLMEVGRYEESAPELLGSVLDDGVAELRVANLAHSDGVPAAGLLSGALLLGVAWAAALMLL